MENQILQYTNILKEELVPAMGCTEPIAIAYASAKAREVLEEIPDRITIEVSGSIIKNVKSVIVPNTDHLKGIDSAAVAGIVAGVSDKKLEVIADVSNDQIIDMHKYLNNTPIEIVHINNGAMFEIIVTVLKKNNFVKVRILNYHTNIVYIEKNGEVLYNKVEELIINRTDRSVLNMLDIWNYARNIQLDHVKDLLDLQIKYNYAIAEEGIRHNYGASIGKVILKHNENNVRIRAKAMAAAGSDARMNGCELPVIINSGSGNQGMTCSIPVIEYAKELNVSKEKLYRALLLSNLTAIHQKTGIGTLSAYCGVVSAGVGAGVGIVYLNDGSYEDAINTMVNALAIVSGIVCDGAKASCASKIVSSLDAVFLAYDMCKENKQFLAGDGIVKNNVEDTIASIGRLSRNGMKSTNDEIIKIMVEK